MPRRRQSGPRPLAPSNHASSDIASSGIVSSGIASSGIASSGIASSGIASDDNGPAPEEMESSSQNTDAICGLESRSESVGTSASSMGYPGLRSMTQTARSFISSMSGSSRRSRAASSIATTESQNLICAISTARGGVAPLVGVVLVNLMTSEVFLSQFNDNQTYVKTTHKLQVHYPSRVLLVASACTPSEKSTLYTLIEELLSDVTVVPADRRTWSEAQGQEYIKRLAFKDEVESVRHSLVGNFYATSAFAAVVTYLETEMGITFASNSLRVQYQPPEDTMMIDISAIESLELLKNLREPNSTESLFGLLNHTQTPMGARLLRSSILQPSTLKDTCLNLRHNAVKVLSTNEELFNGVRKALPAFKDIEKVLTKLVIIQAKSTMGEAESVIDRILLVKSFVLAVPELYEALQGVTSHLLVKIRELCGPELTGSILTGISGTISEDARLASTPLDRRNQRTFAVKSGVRSLLDMSRQTYKDLTEDVHKHVENLNESLGIQAMLKYENGRGYWLLIKDSDFEDRGGIPDQLIYRVMKKGKIECQTLALRKLNERIRAATYEVLIQSDGAVATLQEYLKEQIPHLFRVSDAVALLDMLASFAHVATSRGYLEPRFGPKLALRAARHPILDKTLGDKLVPNDSYASDDHIFHIVTGCNMSGKSTYLRTVTLLQIMAQIGSFVPAEFALFPIIRKIFARVSLDDNIEENMSTFSVEMRDMAFITQNIDEDSLAIIDELGRGTSTTDGLAIAIALSEALINSKAQVWFATHFTDLAKILSDRIGVVNLHLATETGMSRDNSTRTRMLYKVNPGATRDEGYGIALARQIGFPARFLDVAEQMSRRLAERRAKKMSGSRSRFLQRRRKLVLSLHHELKQTAESKLEPKPLQNYLKVLQDQFVLGMAKLEAKGGVNGREGREGDGGD